jgi:hypothetical protein
VSNFVSSKIFTDTSKNFWGFCKVQNGRQHDRVWH